MTNPTEAMTEALEQWKGEDAEARERVIAAVYDELHRLAKSRMRTERPGHTLQTTALVNETYLRLAAQRVPIENRSKFFALAARLMRRVLVDHARARAATRRGGDQVRVTLGPANDGQVEPGPVDLLALEQALERLSLKDPRQTRIVELRFFAGLTIPETAEVVGVSHTIVEREWALARAWLQRELRSTTA